MEIVLATIALQFRFIDERAFAALVAMAMVGPRTPMSGYEIGGAMNRLSRAAPRPDSSADRST